MKNNNLESVVLDTPKTPVPLQELIETEEKHWQKIREVERRQGNGELTAEEAFEERKRLASEYQKYQADLRPFIYRSSIGHYGGLYVEVPEELFLQFKSLFPKTEFPREANLKRIDVREEWTAQGEANFRKRFPDSNTLVQIFFDQRTKAYKRLNYCWMPIPQ